MRDNKIHILPYREPKAAEGRQGERDMDFIIITNLLSVG